MMIINYHYHQLLSLSNTVTTVATVATVATVTIVTVQDIRMSSIINSLQYSISIIKIC